MASVDEGRTGVTGVEELWVCFEAPPLPPPSSAIILSFLPPGIEWSLERQYGSQMVSGRAIVQDARVRARTDYVELVARIGSTPCIGGLTLRQALQGPGNYSRWWLLDLTEKDCLSDDDVIYLTLLRLAAIDIVKQRHGVERTRFYGAPAPFAAALGDRAGRGSLTDIASAVARGVAGRIALLFELSRVWRALRGGQHSTPKPCDVLLHGYWDWTVQPDSVGSLRDRYFGELPRRLSAGGLRVGWLVATEPHAVPWQRTRRVGDVVATAAAHPEITLLERFLSPADMIRGVTNLRHAVVATRAVMSSRFRQACRVGRFDMYPVIRRPLLRAAWGGTCCRLQLMATAVSRACSRIQPAVVMTAFELFVRVRVVYAGVRAGAPGAAVWAAQHAGYSSDKTLGALDPDIEFRGQPDGCPVPAPDGIFVMGSLSARILASSGFASEQLVVTGGLRYESVRIESRASSPRSRPVTILLVGGVGEAAHVDLCDAAASAVSSLQGVRLQWRDHPHYPFSRRAVFDCFRSAIAVTTGSLDEDLRQADLVLFSQSGVGEEAVLRGIPTWQWLWPGFNTSPFLDVPVIPSFTSVSGLRGELQVFLRNPAGYRPAADVQQRVRTECFGPDPAGASVRIADAVQGLLRQGRRSARLMLREQEIRSEAEC